MSAGLSMQTRVRHFLAERRRLGFELTNAGLALHSFARYIDALGHRGPLTVEIMADWARRLKMLRPFARYLQQFEPRTEVPDESIFGPVDQRLAPHIDSEQEFVDLLRVARQLRPDLRGIGLRGLVWPACLNRTTTFRSPSFVLWRCRSEDRHAHGASHQIRQVTAGTATSEHHSGVVALSRLAQSVCRT